MKSNLMKSFFFFALMMTMTIYGLGQNRGVLTGTVTDLSTGSTLPGATIIIAGTNQGTSTGVEGDYTLTNIPAGSNKIIFSFVSYKSDTVDVNIVAGETKVLDVQLSVENIGLDEVIITAQLLGQKKAISTQLNADAIVNVVSDDKIQELPDVNAAEAIARLPGIAINRSGGEGQKIVIRGMEPKYAAITVNGIRVPSNSAGDRSVDLSLISPEMLSGIEVFKSPLPNMDAESSAGTVNLSLQKAPDRLKVLAKGLGGYNDLVSEFKDYKGVVQLSNRFFNGDLGVIGQASVERFNRSGDVINYNWAQGGTNEETGITTIRGRSLSLSDNQEIRKRTNANINLDYDLNENNSFAFFTLFSRTNRDRFVSTNVIDPGEPIIRFNGTDSRSNLDLTTLSLSGDHTFGKISADWSLSTSKSEGDVPYSFDYVFNSVTVGGLFDPELDRSGHPKTFLDASILDAKEVYLANTDLDDRNTLENSNLAFINFKIPFQLADKINVSFEFGGRYSSIDRSRNVTTLSEAFYYLGGAAVQDAAQLYDGELIYIPSNPSLISIDNFTDPNKEIGVELENGTYYPFPVTLDKNKIEHWSDNQKSTYNNNRYALVNNYEVSETVSAGYAMLKINVGNMLTLIPGFRYEYSDNSYMGGVSTASSVYGMNGEIRDTTTYQTYGEFFPHLHMKFKPFDWFDVRASYAKTIARPNFNFVTPTAQINPSQTTIRSGNPILKYALTTSYDINFSFFDPDLGLFTIGAFRKNVENITIPRRLILTSFDVAKEYGWEGYSGYELTSHFNIPESKVWGFETELQTNLSFLPQPFSGIVLSANYSKLFSETEVYFLTSKTVFEGGFPPIPVTTYTENSRTVSMPSQAPEIFRASIGYDFKGFSARVSGSFQGTKARSYSLNKDFDSYDLEFWRWDASIKQKIDDKWSVFLNLNNFSDQKDIRFTRTSEYIRTIERYGFTSTFGVQFKL